MIALLLPLLPLAAWALLALLAARGGRSRREAAVLAAVGCGVFLVVSTEALSAARLVTRWGVAAAWGCFAAALAAALVAGSAGRRRASGEAAGLAVREERGAPGSALELVSVAGLLALLALVGAVALAAPPNTWDSLTYHLSRVAHWEQNRSVAHYPTNIQRQLYMPPGAEWWILHLELLRGDDRLANLVQWAALGGSALGASWAAALLGAGRAGQVLAAALAGTVPMAVMQASGTKNDLVCAFWLLAGAGLARRASARAGGNGAGRAAAGSAGADLGLVGAAAAAFGLAMLTKATGYLYAAPFLAGAALRLGRRRGAVAGLALLALLPLALNAGHLGRNLALAGAPFGEPTEPSPGGPYRYANERLTAGATFSNALRNAALQLGTPDPAHLTGWVALDALLAGPLEALGLEGDPAARNGAVERLVRRIHRAAGLDPDDPGTTWRGRFRVPGRLWNHEDYVSSPLHAALLALGALLLPLLPAGRRGRAAGHLAAVGVAFLLFCVLLRWQVWNNRLTMPLLLLAAPAAGVALAPALGRRGAAALAGALVLAALPAAVNTANRPVFAGDPAAAGGAGPALAAGSVFRAPRERQYFADRPDLLPSYAAAADAAAGLGEVGLATDNEGWEYGLWALLRLRGARPRIEHVDVRLNASRALAGRAPFAGFAPTHVVSIRRAGGARIRPVRLPLPTLPPPGTR